MPNSHQLLVNLEPPERRSPLQAVSARLLGRSRRLEVWAFIAESYLADPKASFYEAGIVRDSHVEAGAVHDELHALRDAGLIRVLGRNGGCLYYAPRPSCLWEWAVALRDELADETASR